MAGLKAFVYIVKEKEKLMLLVQPNLLFQLYPGRGYSGSMKSVCRKEKQKQRMLKYFATGTVYIIANCITTAKNVSCLPMALLSCQMLTK